MKKNRVRFKSKKQPNTIVVIGFGRFGQLLTSLLLAHTTANIVVVVRHQPSGLLPEFKDARITFAGMAAVATAEVVIPCVPISKFEEVIKSLIPFLAPGTLVMDICSVKIFPTQVMQRLLPNNVSIIATHPMFGPDSYKLNGGLQGLRLMISNVTASAQTYASLVRFFQGLKIAVIELSPTEHDQLLALSLGYSYLVGKIGQRLQLKPTKIDTLDFELLLKHTDIIASDSETLFWDIQTYNPFAPAVLKAIKKTVQQLQKEITLKQKEKNYD